MCDQVCCAVEERAEMEELSQDALPLYERKGVFLFEGKVVLELCPHSSVTPSGPAAPLGVSLLSMWWINIARSSNIWARPPVLHPFIGTVLFSCAEGKFLPEDPFYSVTLSYIYIRTHFSHFATLLYRGIDISCIDFRQTLDIIQY